MIPRKLMDEIERWKSEKKYGHIQINFKAGVIENINLTESVRVVQLGLQETPSTTFNGSINSISIGDKNA